MSHPPAIAQELAAKRCGPDAVLRHIAPGSELIVGVAHAEYSAAMIGHLPFFLEANHAMRRMVGANQVHISQVVGCVVTEYGVAELRGRSIRERTRQLIGIAHPKFREALTRTAHEIGYLSS